MTRRDPRTRPTAAEAFAHFETIRGSLEAKYLRIPLEPRLAHARHINLHLKAPRRAVSTMHISDHIPHHVPQLRPRHSHGSWGSADSGRTLVGRIPVSSTDNGLKRQELVTRAVFGTSEPVAKPLDKKKPKGSPWSVLKAVVRIAIR